MALRTIDAGMATFQRVLGSCMFFHAEKGRLPALHRVTLCTVAFSPAVGELPLVKVCMAVQAICKGQALFEVAADVAGGTTDPGVLAQQGILRSRVIEREA